jgi:hypothetical protein
MAKFLVNPWMGWNTCAQRDASAPLICADRLLAGLAARAVTRKDGIACTLRLKKA